MMTMSAGAGDTPREHLIYTPGNDMMPKHTPLTPPLNAPPASYPVTCPSLGWVREPLYRDGVVFGLPTTFGTAYGVIVIVPDK